MVDHLKPPFPRSRASNRIDSVSSRTPRFEAAYHASSGLPSFAEAEDMFTMCPQSLPYMQGREARIVYRNEVGFTAMVFPHTSSGRAGKTPT